MKSNTKNFKSPDRPEGGREAAVRAEIASAIAIARNRDIAMIRQENQDLKDKAIAMGVTPEGLLEEKSSWDNFEISQLPEEDLHFWLEISKEEGTPIERFNQWRTEALAMMTRQGEDKGPAERSRSQFVRFVSGLLEQNGKGQSPETYRIRRDALAK